MASRVSGFTVTIEQDIREDDAEPIAQAILQLRGVADVAMIVADNSQTYAVRVQERLRLQRAIMDVFLNQTEK